MIRKIALLMVLFAFALFISGCAAPEYQFCCFKDEALNDTAPVCKGMNESNDIVSLPVVGCDAEEWICELEETYTSGENEGEHKVAPICPQIETTPCNTTCAGVFCGSFFYDPRPPAAGYGLDEAHAPVDDEEEDETSYFAGEPMGLWNAQCVLKNMSPLFLRQLENSDNIVMNKFRFGVGDSFQEFEDAQYFFPLTDEACYLNAGGSVDRYTVYALSGTLCPRDTEDNYVCTYDDDIHSKRFYDCALRCNLYNEGYGESLEPFNPYLSAGSNSAFGQGFPNFIWMEKTGTETRGPLSTCGSARNRSIRSREASFTEPHSAIRTSTAWNARSCPL
jgi:hypothetical protein